MYLLQKALYIIIFAYNKLQAKRGRVILFLQSVVFARQKIILLVSILSCFLV